MSSAILRCPFDSLMILNVQKKTNIWNGTLHRNKPSALHDHRIFPDVQLCESGAPTLNEAPLWEV